MLPVSRREYKVMLDHRLFAERKPAAEAFGRELAACAARFKGVACDARFEKTKKRELVFLDTRDFTIRLNRLAFRRRHDLEKDKTEYTLKCRSPDRYVAAGADLRAAPGLADDVKLEEDIGAPFVVRFSHSNTVAGPAQPPHTLADAARLFPALLRLQRDGEPCPDQLELRPVNALEVYERVLAGPTLRFNKTEAEAALILWSDGADGRPLVAEFSFRYGHDDEDYSPKAARKALEFFAELERLDWCLPGARTKTQYTYGE